MPTRPLVRHAAALLVTGLLALAPAANAQPQDVLARGELLYSTHCVSCHTAQMHWRDSKLVADWDTLKAQVRRWQKAAALGWSEDDINSVALYLNQRHYGYPVDQYGLPSSDAPDLNATRR